MSQCRIRLWEKKKTTFGWRLQLCSYLAGIQVSPSLLCACPQTHCVTLGSSGTSGCPEEARRCRSWKVSVISGQSSSEGFGRSLPQLSVTPPYRLPIDPLQKLLPSLLRAPPPCTLLFSPLPLHSCCHPRRTSQKTRRCAVAEQHYGTGEASNGFRGERGPVIGGGCSGGGGGGCPRGGGGATAAMLSDHMASR